MAEVEQMGHILAGLFAHSVKDCSALSQNGNSRSERGVVAATRSSLWPIANNASQRETHKHFVSHIPFRLERGVVAATRSSLWPIANDASQQETHKHFVSHIPFHEYSTKSTLSSVRFTALVQESVHDHGVSGRTVGENSPYRVLG
jgi:hypothetical protein